MKVKKDVILPSPPVDGLSIHDEETEQGTMTSIRTFQIEDPVFEETYTAHVKKDPSGLTGWIPDVPEVECTAQTEEDLLKILSSTLQEALEAEEEEWKRQFKEAVKTGKFEPLREEALEDVRTGRFTYL